jgi:hypothetical protein
MVDVEAMRVQVAAYKATVAERLRWVKARLAARRHVLVSALMVIVGVTGLLLGAWTVGWAVLGVTAMALSAGLIWLGMSRDDGQPVPVRGARTPQQVLDDERLRP